MNESYECKNQNPMAEEIFRMFNHPPDQKEGECEKDPGEEFSKLRDELEQNNYLRKAERAIQDTMKQNADLRERIAQYQEKIGELEQEIRKRDSEGGTVNRLIQKVMDGDVTEIQISFRMKRYFDD